MESIVRLESVHMKLQAALQVTSLVLVNHTAASQFIKHSANLREESLGSTLVGGVAKSFHGVTRRFMIIPVLQPFGLGLADSFFR